MSSLGLTPLPRNESAQSLNRKPSEPEKAVREPNNALQPTLGPSVNMNEQGIDPSAAELGRYVKQHIVVILSIPPFVMS